MSKIKAIANSAFIKHGCKADIDDNSNSYKACLLAVSNALIYTEQLEKMIEQGLHFDDLENDIRYPIDS
tara:strand:- start:1297 stop:1503 length:207 start_codon:yes stop_codon:yes gene_type:complete